MVDKLIGTTLGEFEIRARIAHGGMARVYRAYQPAMDREVALKILHLDDIDTDASHDDSAQRFRQEAAVIASLEHIHILPVYSYGIEDDTAYIAMRLLTGGSLADSIGQGPINIDRALAIFQQIAKGLAYAHSKGVVHRDLKPSNILLDQHENAYLTDFGLARVVYQDGVTLSGNIVGTPHYMAPEQMRGEKIDHRADVYSSGLLLYEMLCGARPFVVDDDSDVVAVIYAHLQQTPIPIRQHYAQIPSTIESVLMQALAMPRIERFQTMRDMVQALNFAIGDDTALPATEYPLPLNYKPLEEIPTPDPADIRVPRPLWRRFSVWIGILLVVGPVLGGLMLNTLLQDIPEMGQVLIGQEVGIGTLSPSDAEIRLAQSQLSGGGFIAVMACNQNSEYHAARTRETTEFARSYDLPTQVFDAQNDTYRQITQIERARTEGARGFVICPIELELLDQSLASLSEAAIPFVIDALQGEMGGVALYTDNYDMGYVVGKSAGQYIIDHNDDATRVVVLTLDGNTTVERRARGMIEGFTHVLPGAQIIARVQGATQEWGRESIARLIDDDVAFDVILSINDAGSFGAIEALEAADIAPDAVSVFSVDAERLALSYIENNYYMRGSLEVARTAFAQGAIDVLVKLFAGTDVQQVVLIPPGRFITAEILEEYSTP